MKQLKKNTLITIILAILIFSCSENIVDPIDKKAEINEDISIIQTKVQYGIDRIYHYKIAVESNYTSEDSLIVLASFTDGSTSLTMKMYDDGISDDSLRNDVVASNNIWSGGINSNSFPSEGDWQLNVEIFILDSTLVSEYVFNNILVNTNTAPRIDFVNGIVDADTLESGFDTRNLMISITDPDNDALGYNDNQTLKLEIRNRDNIDKDYEFARVDPLSNMVIQLDSSLAVELATNDNYDLTFIATDYYGESDSLSLSSIRIENTAPTIYDLQFPDTLLVPINENDSLNYRVTVNVNDSQGHLEGQDIKEVLLTTVSSNEMRDDGSESGGAFSSGDLIKDDGVYTVSFTVKVSYLPDSLSQVILPFTIKAFDKADNESILIEDEFLFIKTSKSKTHRVDNAEKFNYINPFNIK